MLGFVIMSLIAFGFYQISETRSDDWIVDFLCYGGIISSLLSAFILLAADLLGVSESIRKEHE